MLTAHPLHRTGLENYRQSPTEIDREDSLGRLMPSGDSLLDIGARDGHYSRLFAPRFRRVIALDLERPEIEHPMIECVAGDITRLQFADASIDCILCAEVLEHIPDLASACANLRRVAKRHILIGVPYRQDIRVDRATCQECGFISPPWGHLHSFTQGKLEGLFPGFTAAAVEFVGTNRESTNAVATWLMDRAGNPWGVYGFQCPACGVHMTPPSRRNLAQRVAGSIATRLNQAHARRNSPWPHWIHILFERR